MIPDDVPSRLQGRLDLDQTRSYDQAARRLEGMGLGALRGNEREAAIRNIIDPAGDIDWGEWNVGRIRWQHENESSWLTRFQPPSSV